MSEDGGDGQQLIANEPGDLALTPQRLPGGDWVLFTLVPLAEGASPIDAGLLTPDENAIALASLSSGERRVLRRGGHNARYVQTGHLVYAREEVLYAVPFDLDGLSVTGAPVPVVQEVWRGEFDVSDQGALVYVPTGGAGGDTTVLALVDRQGNVERLNAPPKAYRSPRLSPDGRRLAVESAEDDGGVIWVYDLADDRAIVQLTFEGSNHRPIWAPDSRRLTFASNRDGTMSLYEMPADGSGVASRLTTAETGAPHWPGSWSPDGQTLLFNVDRGLTDWDIWMLSREGSETQSLYDRPDTAFFGAELSPDGQWLAYAAGVAVGAADVYVEPFPPTGSRRRISQNGGLWPLWSQNASELRYRLPVNRGRGLRTVEIALEPAFAVGNEQTLPVDGFAVVAMIRNYDLMPDGERMIMMFPADFEEATDQRGARINMVLNWDEELKRLVPVD